LELGVGLELLVFGYPGRVFILCVGVPPTYSFLPISHPGPTNCVQKKHRVKCRIPSVLKTPYFSAKNDYAFQIPIPGLVLYYSLTSSPDFQPGSIARESNTIFYYYIELSEMQMKS